MSDSKIFRIPWFPNQAYLDFSRLDPNEIGVLMQIINLIYMNQGPIANDPKWISKSFYDFGTAKTKNVINSLIEKGHLQTTLKGFLTQKRAQSMLETVSKSREYYSEMGSKGAETRYKNNKNQQLDLRPPKSPAIASNSISDSVSYTPLPPLKGGTGGMNNSKPLKHERKKHGKSKLAEQARQLMDKYRDQEPDQNDDSVL
jgi:hypothetical protein